MRTVVFDEESLFSEAIAALLARRGNDVVDAPNVREKLLELVQLEHIDACLISVGAGKSAEIDLIRELRAVSSTAAIVALGDAADLSALLSVLGGGADGFCLKIDGVEEIEALLRKCVESRRTSRPVANVALSSGATAASRKREPNRGISLTPRESKVLELLIEGAGTPKIASELGVGEATIRTHLQHLFSKFGVHSRLALIAQAIRSNVVEISGNERLPAAS